jgi:hypothetical protein
LDLIEDVAEDIRDSSSEEEPDLEISDTDEPEFDQYVKQILKERGLWPAQGQRLNCPLSDGQSKSCQPEGGCCARKVLTAERDFREQKCQLQEELEARGQVVLFLPKFHCELAPSNPTGARRNSTVVKTAIILSAGCVTPSDLTHVLTVLG